MPLPPSSSARYVCIALALSAALSTTFIAPPARAQDSPPPPPPGWTPTLDEEYSTPPTIELAPYAPPGTAPLEPALTPTGPGAEPPVTRPSVPPNNRDYYIWGGVLTFGFTYTLTALIGSTMNAKEENSGNNLFVPVVGPLMHGVKTKEENDDAQEALAFSFALQAIGAAAIVVGLATPKAERVPVNSARVRLTPMAIGQRGAGLGLIGRF